ncbi:hypothetical protein PUNSTDRAFT_27499, partial [Punctularia strigosozonata HHB-11173 SS5]|uniref:uncharacterized protein n=1 Tax=Punctularia strigosozonata (strain HHB-11173) TaxID=741275 RepID=UPI0004416766
LIRDSQLAGMPIPGSMQRYIISLFADDTTVVLSKNDSFYDLTMILEIWCTASGAKFNVPKTAIIPLGPEEYRKSLIETRKLNGNEEPIPPDIKIAADEEAIRLLGAWIGNKVDDATPWGTTIEKIESALVRWGRSNPTLEGRRLIIQMIIGGMTQYLTKVQSMPKHVEKLLSRRIQTFMWNGSSIPPI